MIAARDLGGACYGDSGGPNFIMIGGALVLAATTITGDTPCYATNVAYRVDTANARTFLAPYVTLPCSDRRVQRQRQLQEPRRSAWIDSDQFTRTVAPGPGVLRLAFASGWTVCTASVNGTRGSPQR